MPLVAANREHGRARRGASAGAAMAGAVTLLVLGITSCGGDPRSIAGFCNLLRRNGAALSDTSDPAGLAALYSRLDAHAPLQIMDQWHTVTALMARVTTFDPLDEKDTQAVIAESLRAKSAIDDVAVWSDMKCKVPLGHIPITADTVGPDISTSADTPTQDTSRSIVVGTMAP